MNEDDNDSHAARPKISVSFQDRSLWGSLVSRGTYLVKYGLSSLPEKETQEETKVNGDFFMCQCTPEIRTPWCGKPGCEMPIESQKVPPFISMKEIWEYVEETARQDAAFYQAYKLSSVGGASQESSVLALLKFLKEQRDNLFKGALESALNYPKPMMRRE